jgi:hypothetical protein
MEQARRELVRKAPAAPQPAELTASFFDPFRAASKYGVPSPFQHDLVDPESDSEDEWPKAPAARPGKRKHFKPEKFLAQFSEHLEEVKSTYTAQVKTAGGQAAYELAATQPGARRLMDLAWALEKLDPGRVCVAVMYSNGTLRIYANTMDDKLVADTEAIAAVANEDFNGPTRNSTS